MASGIDPRLVAHILSAASKMISAVDTTEDGKLVYIRDSAAFLDAKATLEALRSSR